MAQLMPLPLTVPCFSKIQIGFTFLVPDHMGSPGQRAIKRVCVYCCILHVPLHDPCMLKPITVNFLLKHCAPHLTRQRCN